MLQAFLDRIDSPVGALQFATTSEGALLGLHFLDGHYPLTLQQELERDGYELSQDLGLHHALKQGGYVLSPRDLAAHAEAWRPWRSYAVMHLWTSLTDQGDSDGPFSIAPGMRWRRGRQAHIQE